MKKLNKLAIKKTTLRDLDEPTLRAMAGGVAKPTLGACPSGACPYSTATFCCTKLPPCS